MSSPPGKSFHCFLEITVFLSCCPFIFNKDRNTENKRHDSGRYTQYDLVSFLDNIKTYTNFLFFYICWIVEGLKAVEIEKCKRDISDIKDQIWNAQKKFVDFNRLRWVYRNNRRNQFQVKPGSDRYVQYETDGI